MRCHPLSIFPHNHYLLASLMILIQSSKGRKSCMAVTEAGLACKGEPGTQTRGEGCIRKSSTVIPSDPSNSPSQA